MGDHSARGKAEEVVPAALVASWDETYGVGGSADLNGPGLEFCGQVMDLDIGFKRCAAVLLVVQAGTHGNVAGAVSRGDATARREGVEPKDQKLEQVDNHGVWGYSRTIR